MLPPLAGDDVDVMPSGHGRARLFAGESARECDYRRQKVPRILRAKKVRLEKRKNVFQRQNMKSALKVAAFVAAISTLALSIEAQFAPSRRDPLVNVPVDPSAATLPPPFRPVEAVPRPRLRRLRRQRVPPPPSLNNDENEDGEGEEERTAPFSSPSAEDEPAILADEMANEEEGIVLSASINGSRLLEDDASAGENATGSPQETPTGARLVAGRGISVTYYCIRPLFFVFLHHFPLLCVSTSVSSSRSRERPSAIAKLLSS